MDGADGCLQASRVVDGENLGGQNVAATIKDIAFRARGAEGEDARNCVRDVCQAVGANGGKVRDGEGEVG